MNSEKYKEGKSVIETYYFVKKNYAESRIKNELEWKESKMDDSSGASHS